MNATAPCTTADLTRDLRVLDSIVAGHAGACTPQLPFLFLSRD